MRNESVHITARSFESAINLNESPAPKNCDNVIESTIFDSFLRLLLAGVATLALITSASADQTKAHNNNNLNLGSNWVSGVAPGGTDNAIWDATVAAPPNCSNTLASAATWSGIVISNPSAPVLIQGNTTLTISNGINLAGAKVNLTINCGTLSLGANQIWTIAPGLTLTTGSSTSPGMVNSPNNGNYVITKTGS